TDDYGGNLTAAGRVYVWMTGAGVANHWRASSTVEIGNMIMDSEASMATMCANKVDLNVQGESWWDSGHSQIYMYSVGNPATFYSGSIECAGVEYLIDSNTKNYITLEYLDCRYTSNNGIVHRAGTNGIVDNCVLKYSGNTLSGNTHWNGSGIWVIANTNSIVSNNTVSYAFKGINPDTNNGSMVILVEDNVITNSIGVDGHADGILFSDGDWDGTYVQRNDISGFKDDGIDMYQGSNIVAQNNIIHDSVGAGEGNGIKMGMTVLDTGNEALRNHIYNLSGGTRNIGIAFNGAASCLAAYNIIHDVAQGMRVGNLDEVTDGDNDNNIMYNNVCYDCSLYGIFTGEGVGGGDQMTVTARNNITSATSRDISNGAFTVMTGGFNCLMNDASVWNAGTYNGAADDLYSTDPKFVDAANDDFRLLMASPCINAGTDVGLTTDYRGRSIRHAPDIGAYEDPTNVLFLTKLFNYIKEKRDGKR
ncbi:right-handed parallel beta-helix repeat-containing protein, partial [bacterium]|nr:right-handed parallel beta-helix repeat-containing protein [bacterium]